MDEAPRCVLVRRGGSFTGAQGLSYTAGLTGASAGTRGFCLAEGTLPPGTSSRAHLHRGIESGGYVVEGTVEMLWGERLEHVMTALAGEFVYIPADVPHVVRNVSDEPARFLVAHSAPDDQQGIVLLPELEALLR